MATRRHLFAWWIAGKVAGALARGPQPTASDCTLRADRDGAETADEAKAWQFAMLDDEDHKDNRDTDTRVAPAVRVNPNRLDRLVLLGMKQTSWYLGGYTRQHIGRELKRAGNDFPRPLPVGPHRIGFDAEEVAAFIVRRANARQGHSLPFAYTDKAVDVMQRLAKLRLVPWKEVERIFLISRQHVRRKQKVDPAFPRQVQVGPNRVCWIAGEIEAWLLALEAATRAKGE